MQLESTYPSTVIHVDSHTSGHFNNAECSARASFYGVSGVPDVRIDGSRSSGGGGDGCTARFNSYRSLYQARMAETGGVSPVSITQNLLTVAGGTATMTCTFTLVDPVALGSVRAYFFLYEDDIIWCCDSQGNNHWNHITRSIKSQDVTTLVNVGDQITITKVVNLDGGWIPENLKAAAILQQYTGTKQIWQATRIPRQVDFTLTVPTTVQSIPAGTGTATFTGQLSNDTGNLDTYTLSVDQGAGWPTDFQIEGDPNWYTSLDVSIAGGVSKQITVRVQTDADLRIGTADFQVNSHTWGRTQVVGLDVFNHSPAILLVDDDSGTQDWNGHPYEYPYMTSMGNLGYLYKHWDAYYDYSGNTPILTDAAGYDMILWVTGRETVNTLTAIDIDTIEHWMDLGKPIYIESMDFLNGQTSITVFLANYLGIDGFNRDTRATTENGVAGDPISDGMSLSVTFGSSAMNKIDTITPRATAAGFLISETGNINAIRNNPAPRGRVVFSSVPAAALSMSDPDPNNVQTLTGGIIRWLLPPDPAGVAGPEPTASTSILTVQPNPFGKQTQVSFQLSPRAAGGLVQLLLVDPSGRQVRSLVQGSLNAGRHTVVWDGKDQSGHTAPMGVYFARLRSLDGESSSKLILAR
jgi:hypothetical protein